MDTVSGKNEKKKTCTGKVYRRRSEMTSKELETKCKSRIWTER